MVIQGIMVEMRGVIRVGMRGISVGMREIRVGMQGIGEGMWGITVGMQGIRGGNVERDKNKRKRVHS